MRVVVTGATGNVGTSVVERLTRGPEPAEVVGVARRQPHLSLPRTTWVAGDVRTSDLVEIFRGADAVVHLAWLIQPSHDTRELESTNVAGTSRVLRAVRDAAVPALVYASSVGAYSPGPKDRAVDERWPTNGIATSTYSRQKAAVERMLDRFEAAEPEIRIVRLRKALVFKRAASSEIRRLFLGPLFPSSLLRLRMPIVPDIERLRFQAVHGEDVGEAYSLAVRRDVHGAFNIAGEPVLDPPTLARLFGARRLPLPRSLIRTAAALSWRLHLQPAEAGWIDIALDTPLMDVRRARETLGWKPANGADEALRELLHGIGEGAGFDTPPLHPRAGGALREREIASGIGSR